MPFRLLSGMLLTVLLYAGTVRAQQTPGPRIPLAEALKKIGTAYAIRFTYESTLVQGRDVAPPELPATDIPPVETVLARVLAPFDLTFTAVSRDFYTIVRKPAKPTPTATRGPAGDTVILVPMSPDALKAGRGEISGHIYHRATRDPAVFATVTVPALGLATASNEHGKFQFNDVPVGQWRVRVQYVAMVTAEQTVDVTEDYTSDITVPLDESVLALQEVEVVARESRAGTATASLISRSAIEHLQATNLADVLQLLPGGLSVNPDFSAVNKVSLRQVSPDNAGSLGTAVIVNGVPVSNNANLQVNNTSSAGANASFATTTGSGVDLRQFTADNIESVEVIRGIPSVEHGDLTSGAILVKTKAGRYPFHIKARVNPTLTQLWAGKGLALNNRRGESLNVDVDYTESLSDQRFAYEGYTRITTNLLYSRSLLPDNRLQTTTGFSVAMNLDEQKEDPDDARLQQLRRAQDYAFRFHTSGTLTGQRPLMRTLAYTAAVSYSVQKGYQQSVVGGATFPLINAMKDTTQAGQFAPAEYLSQVWVEGKPLSVFTKITDSFFGQVGRGDYRVLLGAEWKLDANLGAGRTYDINRPPQTTTGGNASRPRAYSAIPALQQYTLYAENNLTLPVAGRTLTWQAGLRMDHIPVAGTAWSPRTNVAYDLSRTLVLRAGWGITAKAPTLLYLYPQNAYFDLVNLNSYAENPAERVLIATTKVYDTRNRSLRIARNTKQEIGVEWHFLPGRQLSVTAYHETLRNGYEFNVTPQSIRITPLQVYRIVRQTPGQAPEVGPDAGNVRPYVTEYNMPTNQRKNTNQGIELDLNLGRVAALRTSFVLNGAWLSSRSVSTGYYVYKSVAGGVTAQGPERVALFAPGRGTEDTRMSTSLRMIHHIPELRFIVSLLAQTVWISRNRYVGYEQTPVGYISRATGETMWLTPEARAQLKPTDYDLYLNVADEYYITESWRPSWLFNLRLTKEVGRNFSFSFYVNNLFMHRPLEESNRWLGSFSYRNQPIFFGTELSLKL